jgi:hypothetical protein
VQSNGQQITFAAPRRLWRRIIAVLLVISSTLLGALLIASPDLDSGIGLVMVVVLLPLWLFSLFGGLVAWLSWFVQVRQGGAGPVAWMDTGGIHVKGGPGISWPEVESVFIRRAPTGELLLCIRPTDPIDFIAQASGERQDGMRSNLDMYEAPLFINLSAFWQGSTEELSTSITTLTSGRLTLAIGG